MADEYRITTVALESLAATNGDARLSTVALEALHSGVSSARVSLVAIEVLRSVETIAIANRRRQACAVN